jgi:hypothetical protein
MQKAYEDQLVNGADGMLFAGVKHKECIRFASMLNAIAACTSVPPD